MIATAPTCIVIATTRVGCSGRFVAVAHMPHVRALPHGHFMPLEQCLRRPVRRRITVVNGRALDPSNVLIREAQHSPHLLVPFVQIRGRPQRVPRCLAAKRLCPRRGHVEWRDAQP